MGYSNTPYVYPTLPRRMGPSDSDECMEGLTWSELVDCLTNSRPEVRAMGAQVALSLTATEVGVGPDPITMSMREGNVGHPQGWQVTEMHSLSTVCLCVSRRGDGD